MSQEGFLVLEDGSVFRGTVLGAPTSVYGEVVFNTSMAGYQEMLTDPSYAGQILVLTYPLIGNYGVNREDFESRRVQVRALVVRELCPTPSHALSQQTLEDFLAGQGIPVLADVDTRALTRRLRSQGVMMGAIALGGAPEEALCRLRSLPAYGNVDYVKEVSTPEMYPWGANREALGRRHIVVVDLGLKYNILRSLQHLGCRVTALPATSGAEEILAHHPDGVVLSPGPGDPALLGYAVETARGLIGKKPLLGICLGHQILGLALGGRTYKLKFGHRGANHPVREVATGQVSITSQNHGYAVDPAGLPNNVEVSHVHLNDGTVEGLRHREHLIFSIQYHAEASPGPLDNVHLFQRWLEMVEGGP